MKKPYKGHAVKETEIEMPVEQELRSSQFQQLSLEMAIMQKWWGFFYDRFMINMST